MNDHHSPNWVEASSMLHDAMEQYRAQQHYPSLPNVIDDIIGYVEAQSGKWMNEKTIKRDAGNKHDGKQIHPIPDWRVKIYAQWLHEKIGKNREWLAIWLEHTDYASPGNLLMEISGADSDSPRGHAMVKTNVPPLKKRLWGRFLGRQEEMEKLRQWADHQRYPIAVLYGFGGNGKTTILQKVGEDFVQGVACPLRWPYDGAVWLSAIDYPRGQPNLTDVLRKIARTFELYDCDECSKQVNIDFVQPEVMKRNVKELLEEKRILVLIDNFETIAKPNQIEILRFFNDLHGSSQTLLSTRYRPDWYLEEQGEMYSMAHVLIRVDGLSSEDAQLLVQEFLDAKSLPKDAFDPAEIKRLTEVTRNNPKTILTVLGLVEQGVSLSHLLDKITSGTPQANEIYDMVIDRAWDDLLTESDQAVLMAKAFFRHPVSDEDLGHVAGVTEHLLRNAIKKLAAISFFEFERTSPQNMRISTHPLAQEFSRRVLHDHPEFEREAEERWWKSYGPRVVQQAGQTAYELLQPELENDVANVLDHLEHHIRDCSEYSWQAAKLFGEPRGLGWSLACWGQDDEVLRVAEIVLEYAIEEQDPQIIGECALHLSGTIYADRHLFDQADRYIGLASEQNAKLHDRWLEANIETFRAYLYSQRRYFRAAEQSYQQALETFLEIGSSCDIAKTYMSLGSVTIEIAIADLEEPIDTSGKAQEALVKAEQYFDRAEIYYTKDPAYQGPRHHVSRVPGQRYYRAVIARLRGDLDLSRELFQSCIGSFKSSQSVADLYHELALVEHLSGNKELAHSYEEKGANLLRQLELETIYPWTWYRIIERMKQEGTW